MKDEDFEHRPLASVDELFAVLRAGAAHHDEPEVDLLSHGLQCAAILDREAPDDDELVVAGLVHDLAGAVDEEARHDRVGARLVGNLLGARVAALVGGHVAAKRYLVATDSSYAGRLSARSVETLSFQGGAADREAIAEFERSPHRDALVALRRADDRAKNPHANVVGLDHWRLRVDRVAARAAGTS